MTTPKITTIKPDGEDGPRYYVFEGSETPVPGVTSVLKMKANEGLIHWAANEAAEFAVRATREYDWEYAPPEHGPFDVGVGWQDLCEILPDTAYNLARKARFKRNREAVSKGNDAHDLIERVAGLSVESLRSLYKNTSDEDVSWALRAWGQFVKRFNVKVLHSEVSVYSEAGYMGSVDLIVEMDTPWLSEHNIERGTIIIDTKTGKGVYPETSMQLAAYRFADYIVDDTGEGVRYSLVPSTDGAAVFWPSMTTTTKNGDYYSLIPANASERDWDTFCALLHVFNWERTHKKQALGNAVVGTKTRKKNTAGVDWSSE